MAVWPAHQSNSTAQAWPLGCCTSSGRLAIVYNGCSPTVIINGLLAVMVTAGVTLTDGGYWSPHTFFRRQMIRPNVEC